MKNASGKTPREEVELVTSIKATHSNGSGLSDLDPDYYKTLAYLQLQEDIAEEVKGKCKNILSVMYSVVFQQLSAIMLWDKRDNIN